MSDYTDKELEHPETWDHASATHHPPVTKPRAIVSVAFSREDFETVAGCAEHVGKKVSEFIRDAALTEARRRNVPETTMLVGSGSLGVIMSTFVSQSATKVGGTMHMSSRELARTG